MTPENYSYAPSEPSKPVEATMSLPPAIEAEVTRTRSVMEKAIDAIINSSNLRVEVDGMKVEVGKLKADVEEYRRRIAEQDDILRHVREQRDTAEQTLSETRRKLGDAEGQVSAFTHENESLHRELAELRDKLKAAVSERDDYGMRNLELGDKLKAAEEKLADIQDMAMRAFNLLPREPAKPVEVPQFIGSGEAGQVGQPADAPPANQANPDAPAHDDRPWWERPASNG